jgi:hypothetical protein
MKHGNTQISQEIKNARGVLRDKSSTRDQRKSARATLKGYKTPIQNRLSSTKNCGPLADLRSGNRSYTHKREEKMALLAEMWVGARPLFERTAPEVFTAWKKFLNDNPKLHALRDIEGNTEVMPISQPYDFGGLVIKGNWYAPEGAARIMNNNLSPGLRSNGAYKAVLGLNNVLNQFQLGLSTFHLGFTSSDAAVSKAALGSSNSSAGIPFARQQRWPKSRSLLSRPRSRATRC